MIEFGDGYSLLDPWFLLAAPLAWGLLAWRLARPRAALPSPDLSIFAGLPRTLRARAWMLPAVLHALALTSFAIALARPVTRDVMTIREAGVDIVLVLDRSSSMTIADMTTGRDRTRLQVAREKALEFAQARTHDRVGLVVFGRFPELRTPLTLDQDALAAFLRVVEPVPRGTAEDMTGIGVALAKAVTLLDDSAATSKVVVLLSDGENNVGDILPEDAAGLAKDAGVVVHCIGIGGTVSAFDPRFGPIEYRVEFEALKGIAERTGGRFFAAESDAALAEAYQQIDAMEKIELDDPRYRTVDWFLAPFLAGAALLVLALFVEFAWIRRLP